LKAYKLTFISSSNWKYIFPASHWTELHTATANNGWALMVQGKTT